MGRTKARDIDERLPVFEWVDPRTLLVDLAYQRELSSRSHDLIHQIIANWDWRRYKPPIAAHTKEGYELIDGQHTAIAAATHPGITKIPVMVLAIDEVEQRASAFISHNRDRVAVTRMQIHTAASVAGEHYAVLLNNICENEGIKILSSQPVSGVYNSGETMAIATLERLVRKRTVTQAKKVLQVVRASDRAPITAVAIKATEMLLCEEDYAAKMDPSEISSLINSSYEMLENEAKIFATTHHIPFWKAFGIMIFKKKRKSTSHHSFCQSSDA